MTVSPWTLRSLALDLVTVDLFCGGGGTSKGFEWALGKPPTVAVNHDPAAIEMHAANHPSTIHRREDVLAVVPHDAIGGRPVDALWASPDCRHHSRAKGGKPVEKDIRGLAWVVVRWAREVRPRVIFLENVPEFTGWGPLYPEDHPDPKLRNRPIPERRGETFAEFVGQLRALGYVVEHRVLNCADFGAPTARKRLFMVARSDGRPIVWPEPTHGPGRPLPWAWVADCIDWSIPSLSIFATREEARAWAAATGADGVPVRPLADATLRRIAAGIVRYVLDDPDPYIAPGPVAATMVHTGNGEREGQAPRTYDIRRPLGTVVASGQKHALVSAFLAKHYGGVVGHRLDRPLGTVTAIDHHSLVAAHLTKFYGRSTGADVRGPSPTVTGRPHAGLVSAFLCAYYGSERDGQGVKEPARTVTGTDRFGLVTVTIDGEPWVVTDIAMRMLQPRELARATGLPDDFVLTGTKKEQVGRIGNMVPPHPAAALIRANFEGEQPRRSDRAGWLFPRVSP